MAVKVGFLGAGFITDVHLWFLSRAEVDHEVVAVHDVDPDRAAAFAARTGAAVLDEAGVIASSDAVFVTTWTSEHPRLVAAVAAAGKAVFCEKPLAVDAGLVAGMVDVVERAGVTNQVGLVMRFLPPMRLVRHLLADPRSGAVLAVSFRDDQYLPIQGQYGSTWRADPERCGRGTMLEHSIHDVDILRWWLGPVAALSATTRTHHGYDLIDDVAAVRFDFASGTVATLVSVWHDVLERPSGRHIEILCERLHVVVEGDTTGPVRWQRTGEPERSLQGRELVAHLAERGDTASNPAESFLAAVRDRRPADPAFAEALPAHAVVDAVYRSADLDGEVIRAPEEVRPEPGGSTDPGDGAGGG
jgi:predicted dehydrogenase